MGEAASDHIRERHRRRRSTICRPGAAEDDQLALAAEYRAFTAPMLPWLIDELDGCAEAAGVDPLAFFACTMEEIWYEPRARVTQGRCSDLVAGPSATADGHLLVAHNERSPARGRASGIVAIEKRVDGDPVVFQLGGVPILSVGFNSAGLALTGNELSPNDEKVGISRDHQVLEMIRARSLDEMVAAALRPDRASSLQQRAHVGRRRRRERGGERHRRRGHRPRRRRPPRAHEPLRVRPDAPLRGRPRRTRSARPCGSHGHARCSPHQPPGSITMDGLRTMLEDHEGAPDSLCRHTEHGATSKTVFWCVADVTEGTVRYGRGNPCDSIAQEYVFADYAAA